MSLPARLLAAAAVLWACALPAAAATAAWAPAGVPAHVTRAMYAAGRIICHQRPERSFHLGATALPVCARCLGLYAGAAVVALLMLGADAPRRAAGTARVAATYRQAAGRGSRGPLCAHAALRVDDGPAAGQCHPRDVGRRARARRRLDPPPGAVGRVAGTARCTKLTGRARHRCGDAVRRARAAVPGRMGHPRRRAPLARPAVQGPRLSRSPCR